MLCITRTSLILSAVTLGAPLAFAADPLRLPSADAPGSAKLPSVMEQIEPAMERFGTSVEVLPPDKTLDDIAATLATPEAAFEWVRDRIALQAYPGSMRGADGTLRAGAGNALDRALLLAAFLKQQGQSVRLARGEVDDEAAEKLLERVTREPVLTPVSEAPLFQAVGQRAARSFSQIKALAAESLKETVDAQAMRDAALEDLREHWWVEIDRDGEWTALDPSLRDAAPGKALAEAGETLDEITDEHRQSIVVRLMAEFASGGVLEREAAIDHRLPAEDFTRSVVVLGTISEDFGSGLADILSGAMGMDAFTPVLRVGSGCVRGSRVEFGKAAAEGEKPAAGGLAGALSALSFDDEPAAKTDGVRELVGVVLEVACEAPGREPVTARRLIYDRLEAADRQAWESKGFPEGKEATPKAAAPEVLAAALGAQHFIHAYDGGHNVGSWAVMFEDLLGEIIAEDREGAGREAEVAAEALQNLRSVMWRTLAVASDLFVTPAANDIDGLRVYPDRPRVAVMSHFIPATANNESGMGISVDLLQDHLRLVPGTEAKPEAIIERQLWLGTLNGALEAEIGSLNASAMNPEWKAGDSTATDLTQLETATAADIDNAGIALRKALANGHIALRAPMMSETNPSFWEIDPATAATRAVTEPGLGAYKMIFKTPGPLNGPNINHLDAWNRRMLDYAARGLNKSQIRAEEARRKVRMRNAAKARAGGVAGEYINQLETSVYNSVPAAMGFAVATGSCMFVGTMAIADGLKGRDWTQRFTN